MYNHPMDSTEEQRAEDRVTRSLYRLEASGTGVERDYPNLDESDLAGISSLMNTLARLREAELLLSEASRKYMKLSDQDMRALHYLIVAKRQGQIVTPSALAAHLRISAASTTKLLNRLERGNHIVRRLHPQDRRAFMIEITPETETSARESVGRQQARRFHAAARLTRDEREVVTRFLADMTDEISLDNAEWTRESDH